MRYLLCDALVTTGFCAVLLAAGCGGGGGGGGGGGSPTPDPAAAVTSGAGSLKILDLATGVVSDADVATYVGSAAPTTAMVFRRIDGGSGLTGSPTGSVGAQSDEPVGTTNVATYYLALTEVTQAQWNALAGDSPWNDTATGADGALVGKPGAVGSNKPAFGLTLTMVTSETAAFLPASGARLRLPSEAEWEIACRGGTTSRYSWGEAEQPAVVDLHARVGQGSAAGPANVATLAVNPFGFHDLHGNLWELAANGRLRGGSWHEEVLSARSANRQSIGAATPHALIGARLVLVP